MYASPAGNGDILLTQTAPPPYSDDVKVKREDSEEPAIPMSSIPRASAPTGRQLTYDELKAKLVEAEAVIESLQKESQLRRRKGATVESEKKGATGGGQLATVTRQDPEGVPVKVVAILCFFTFLLSYIFF